MNQFKLIFQLENNRLPKSLDKAIVSFLKAAAENYSPVFFNKLYDKSKSIIKGYTYSYYLPGAKFCGDTIELSREEFTLFFSDIDQAEFLHFFNAFQGMKHRNYPLSGNSMVLVSIRMQELNEIKENEIIVKMQSPLIVRRHNSEDNSDIYYTCETEGFAEALKDNVGIFLDKMGIDISASDFSIEAVKGKKVVVPVFERNVDASIGIYKLSGPPQLLNILYLAGIGVRRSAGHGKFEVIG